MAITPSEADSTFRRSAIGTKYEERLDRKLRHGERNFDIVLENGEINYREQIESFVRNIYQDAGWKVDISVHYERGDYTQSSYCRMSFKFAPANATRN